jgi:CubicO group peptidase (beta-lactamase class C family)
LDFKSGTQFRYDNSGYIFLGAIIEKVSGKQYAEYIQHHIFKPLGMVNSGYDDTKTILYHRALGYERCGKTFCNANYIDMSLPFAAGSLIQKIMQW